MKNDNKHRLWPLVIFLILSVIILSGCHEKELINKKLMMEKYLQKKYGKEFVINRIRYCNIEFGEPAIYKATAHPKDDPCLTFEVNTRYDGSIYEEYVYRMWGIKLKLKLNRY